MGRMLATCLLAASILAAGPAFDKRPRIWAQPLEEKTMVEKSYGIKVAPKIKSFLDEYAFKVNPSAVMETAGSRKIKIEMRGKEEAEAYAWKYNRLVSAISYAIKENEEYINSTIGYWKEGQFMNCIWAIMDSALCMRYEGGAHMSLIIKTGRFNCSTSSFLVFDVAKELDIKVEIVSVRHHFFIKTENFLFETTNGQYDPIADIRDHYPVIYNMTSDPEKIQSIDYAERGRDYANRGKNQKAIKDYNKAISIDSTNVSAYFGRGEAYYSLGNYWQAVGDYNKAISIDSTDVDFYKNRGEAYYSLGNYWQAVGDYTKVVALSQSRMERASYYEKLGGLYFDLKNYKKAVRNYSKAIKLNPNDLDLYHSRAYAYAELGMKKEMEEDGKKVDSLWYLTHRCEKHAPSKGGKIDPLYWVVLGGGIAAVGYGVVRKIRAHRGR
jgi:tetratricopeptide (TPR) repeat protein